MFWSRRRSNDDAQDGRPNEPRTVPETQRWLSSNGYRECTENNAKHALFMRGLVRDGTVNDDKR